MTKNINKKVKKIIKNTIKSNKLLIQKIERLYINIKKEHNVQQELNKMRLIIKFQKRASNKHRKFKRFCNF